MEHGLEAYLKRQTVATLEYLLASCESNCAQYGYLTDLVKEILERKKRKNMEI